MVLTDLEQLKVLADPLRVRILESMGVERTTKQVAERMGEKSTKLYHHVDALERVGLIKLTRTRRKRGTLEKYYQVVARSFRADSSLFPKSQVAAGPGHPAVQVVSNMLATVGEELGALAKQAGGISEVGKDGILTSCEVRASQKEIVEIQQKLEKLLHELIAGDESDPADKERRFRLFIAYYPLPEQLPRS
jgi:DNA-binding transcriptional ArsR family regulator